MLTFLNFIVLGLLIALSGNRNRIKSKKIAHENAKPRVIGRRKATGPPQADRRVARGALKAGLPGNGGTAFFFAKFVYFFGIIIREPRSGGGTGR